jgi:formate dehydrogenase subunit gamma
MAESNAVWTANPQPWDAAVAERVIREKSTLPGATMPILHALQQTFGYVDKAAIPIIADILNVSQADIVGVVSFYHDFRETPAGRHTLRLCRAEACQSLGADDLVASVSESLGIEDGQTTPDGNVTLQEVFCLGNCALSPAMMLDGKVYGRVTTERIEKLLAGAAS